MFEGGETITVVGINLPTSSPNVNFGTQQVMVVSSTSTQLVLKSPAMAPGVYSFNLIGDLGNAKSVYKRELRLIY